MEEEKRKLVIDGNAFYEIDLECLRQKEKKKEDRKTQLTKKGQRR